MKGFQLNHATTVRATPNSPKPFECMETMLLRIASPPRVRLETLRLIERTDLYRNGANHRQDRYVGCSLSSAPTLRHARWLRVPPSLVSLRRAANSRLTVSTVRSMLWSADV